MNMKIKCPHGVIEGCCMACARLESERIGDFPPGAPLPDESINRKHTSCLGCVSVDFCRKIKACVRNRAGMPNPPSKPVNIPHNLTAAQQIRIAALNASNTMFDGVGTIKPINITTAARYFEKYITTGEVEE